MKSLCRNKPQGLFSYFTNTPKKENKAVRYFTFCHKMKHFDAYFCTFAPSKKYKIMGKITAKHFLNTNLKPYIINGTKHFSIYILLVANRQNTKVKSIKFDEYYSEDFFNDIINSTDIEDIKLIANEISTITRITEIILDELKNFDTAFITAYFKFCSMLNIDSDVFNEKDYKDYRSINNIYYYSGIYDILSSIEIDNPKDKYYSLETMLQNEFRSITLFDFYNDENQNKLKQCILENSNLKDIDTIVKEYNKVIFYNSLNRFLGYIQKTKNEYLKEKYNFIFQKSYLFIRYKDGNLFDNYL